MLHRFAPLVIALALCMVVPSALAETPDELARSHFLSGQSYYRQGRYADAIREFEEAQRLSPKPHFLFNIAQAYEKWGKLERAIEYLERALQMPEVPNKLTLQEHLRQLRQRLAASAVKVTCNEPGATVTVDGKKVGVTPLKQAIALRPGEYEVKVTKAKHMSYSTYVTVIAGRVARVKATLRRVQDPVRGLGEDAGYDYSDPLPRKRVWTWVLAGTAGAFAVAAGVTGGLALSRAGDAPASEGDEADSARTLALVSDISTGVAAAAAVGAVVLFFLEGRHPEPPEAPERNAPRLAPLIAPDTAGVSAGFSF